MILVHKRLIKTGIAVIITMFILNRLKLEPAVFGAVSAILSLQPTISLSFKNAKQQIEIQALGILTGLLLGYLLGGNPLTMGLAAIIIIYLYNKINLQNGVVMGVVAALFIITSPADQFLSHAFSRTLVILTGLTVSSIINVVLWPPRYGKRLQELLLETDLAAVAYFQHAINDFVHLDHLEIHSHQEKSNELKNLLSETHKLINYLDKESPLRLKGEFIYEYLKGVSTKAESIYAIIPVRIERRKKQGNLPVTTEFKSILDLLQTGTYTIDRINKQMRLVINDENISAEKEAISEEFWISLTEALEAWQYKLNSNDYIHAVIDIAVVANEIRWASRQGKKVFNSLIEEEYLTQKSV